MNESPSNCPACGAALPANAPQGLCPKCLLLGVAAPTESGEAHSSQRPPPPSRESVAAAFPQLEILELIGQGGMGCVFKARQPQLNRVVALKILPEALSRDAAFATRFTREAQALAALNHSNIVTIHDFGQAGGFFYLLMEFVDGVNLRQALRGGRFTPEQALAIVPPLCEALQFAHDRGIVHRDIKPENLLLDRAGHVKIADFGIAKMLGTETSSIGVAETQPAGTPGYMAPEQRSAPRTVDSRADIYSLGVVFYEMLTGELPEGKLQPPSSRVRGMQIDVRLDAIVLRALETTPELRYQTAAELRTQVERVTQSGPSSARDEDLSGGVPAKTAPAHAPRWVVAWGAAVAIAAVVLVFFNPWARRTSPQNVKVAKEIVIQFDSVTNFDNRSIVASSSADLLPGERILARVRRGNGRADETLVTQNITIRGAQERHTVSLFWQLRPTDAALAESAEAQARRFQNVAALHLAEGQWTRVFAVTNEAGIPLEAEACFQRTLLSNETATAEIRLKPGASGLMLFFRHQLPDGTMLVATATSRGSATDSGSVHMYVSGPDRDGHASWQSGFPSIYSSEGFNYIRRRTEQLQAEGPIRLRPGERKEIYSLTNAPGEVFSAALELRSTPPPMALR